VACDRETTQTGFSESRDPDRLLKENGASQAFVAQKNKKQWTQSSSITFRVHETVLDSREQRRRPSLSQGFEHPGPVWSFAGQS
jgi:hypothetical protein